jgi:cytidine deaminase
MDMEALFLAALKAAAAAYAPYSRFRVGAALLGADGRIFTGCNVENRSFGLTICAEQSALVQGVSGGVRSFLALAVAALDSGDPIPPLRRLPPGTERVYGKLLPGPFWGFRAGPGGRHRGGTLPLGFPPRFGPEYP